MKLEMLLSHANSKLLRKVYFKKLRIVLRWVLKYRIYNSMKLIQLIDSMKLSGKFF